MKREQTELIDYIINPTFLEQMKQSVNSIAVQSWFSFNMERNGMKYHVTMYTGNEGQVNISSVGKFDTIGNTIIRDFCQNINDFLSMLKKLDDLQKRMPMLTDV